MGSCSSDSTCCGSKHGALKPDIEDTGGTVKKKRSSKSYRNTDKRKKISAALEPKCVITQDISQCESFQRILKVINKYNEWLHSNSLLDDKHLSEINDQETDYHQYYHDINRLIVSINTYSIDAFLSDSTHIEQKHYYKYKEMRRYYVENTNDIDNLKAGCSNNHCFSMKHYFLRNKQRPLGMRGYDCVNPLEMLTNFHIYMFHAVYISELKMHHLCPHVNAYVVATYVEHTQRTIKIKEFPLEFNREVVHFTALYFGDTLVDNFGSELIDNEVALDAVSAQRLAQFLDNTIDDSILNKVWSELDRDASNSIDATEVDEVLLLIVVIMIGIAHKDSGHKKLQIDKDALKHSIQPIAEWMKRDKMSEKPQVKKEEFTTIFSEWLKEYHVANGGIVANDEMQKQLLKKYKVSYEKVEYDFDRLVVVDCEYLETHSSSQSNLNPDAKAFNPGAQ